MSKTSNGLPRISWINLAKNLDGDRSKNAQKTDGLSVVRSLGGQETGGGKYKWTQHHEVTRPLVIFAA